MTEPKYPRAFGVCIFWPSGMIEYESVWATKDMATRSAYNWVTPTKVVELIPLPEHEAIVAAAVAAERERCAGIAKRVADETGGPNRSYLDHFEQERIDTADMIERKIREVPT